MRRSGNIENPDAEKTMRAIYAYEFDASNINVQSGRPFSVLREMKRRGTDIVPVFPLEQRLQHLFLWKKIRYRLGEEVYRPDRESALLRSLAHQIERRVNGIAADFLFAPGSHAIAELDTPHPKVFCADATFANVIDFYDTFTNCAPEFIRQGHAQDQKALMNCAAAIYPSDWAARSAIEFYGVDPGKIHVIPFGANVEVHDAATVKGWIDARPFDRLDLLFVGRDWRRKGGDIVLAVCDHLSRAKVPVHLDIVGVTQTPVPLPPYARLHGLLDKNDPTDRRRLESLLAKAHFFFVPSRAENYGMAFCEAAAYGVPSVTTNVGGIPTIVQHGRTGFTFAPDSPPDAFAEAIEGSFRSLDRYRDLARSSFADYEKRLNWNAFGERFFEVVRQIAG